MPLVLNLRVTGDPAAFETYAADDAETITRIVKVAKGHVLMKAVGVSAQPEIEFWPTLDTNDAIGWRA